MTLTVLRWIDPPSGPAIELLDQTKLPLVETTITCTDVPTLIDAIRRLAVRGAPLLGIAGAYGVALAAARGDDVPAAAAAIERARPTAVNLGWAARLALDAYLQALGTDNDQEEKRIAALAALRAAHSIEEADRAACDQMAAARPDAGPGRGQDSDPLQYRSPGDRRPRHSFRPNKTRAKRGKARDALGR